MTAAVSFTVFGQPQGKQRPRLGVGGHVFTPTKTKRYEASVAWAATVCRPRAWSQTGPVCVRVSCFFADNRVHDVDNVLKCVMDGMKGVVYHDDTQVVSAQVFKALDRLNPRIEVRVSRAET